MTLSKFTYAFVFRLTWPLRDGSMTAPKIKLAVGSTRSYMTSAAAFTYGMTKDIKN